MPLSLRYRINEGITVHENTEEGGQISVEVIVRNIDLFPEGVNVNFELRNLVGSRSLSLTEDQRYDVTPLCTLKVPRDPLRIERVFLTFIAPRVVVFSNRRMYSPEKEYSF